MIGVISTSNPVAGGVPPAADRPQAPLGVAQWRHISGQMASHPCVTERIGISEPRLAPTDELALLGTAKDSQTALRLGKSTKAVREQRQRLRIRSAAGWTDENRSWLGVDTDRAIAAALGRSESAVSQQRRHLGIPVYRDE
jgi:hypothetical protein